MSILHQIEKFKRSINCFTYPDTIYAIYFKVYNNLKLKKKKNINMYHDIL